MSSVYLRKPQINDLAEIKEAYERSVQLHQPWTYPPSDFKQYLTQEHRYFVCLTESHTIVGTFNISNIIRGYFHSAYLGYEVFHPYQGRGYMKAGLKLLLSEAFEKLNLHRLEANIQPKNIASIHLVSNAGFIKEGFSRQYLRVGGKDWKDHERWAILNEMWNKTSG
ncbi:ribosomal-protein-alanine acetyltransferase family protein [Acinetobacter calcoaceticus RUH2202]|uniref:GNAT family N-acetyltransferase n=1 Tax=Acinetobacter calcoaceticus TaxID=471 RepID=UPI0001BB5CDC|nr:GNAT family protein [Acinetobacter calcoaceticus]EEY75722.1 ribosomal-protein-alanine acetyltransferase family protein [Acinetobacter calcoaceticus RUH2202]